MNTKLWYKIFYAVSVLLLILFAVFVILNKRYYDATDTTLVDLAPFGSVLKRLCQRFLIPGILFLVAAIFSHIDVRKNKESENENNNNK